MEEVNAPSSRKANISTIPASLRFLHFWTDNEWAASLDTAVSQCVCAIMHILQYGTSLAASLCTLIDWYVSSRAESLNGFARNTLLNPCIAQTGSTVTLQK